MSQEPVAPDANYIPPGDIPKINLPNINMKPVSEHKPTGDYASLVDLNERLMELAQEAWRVSNQQQICSAKLKAAETRYKRELDRTYLSTPGKPGKFKDKLAQMKAERFEDEMIEWMVLLDQYNTAAAALRINQNVLMAVSNNFRAMSKG